MATTTKNLEGLTVNEIKSQYPNGAYKSGMLKKDVIKAALASEAEVKETKSSSPNREPGYGR